MYPLKTLGGMAFGMGVASAFGDITDRVFHEEPPKPAPNRTKARKPALRPIIEERQKPKEKSASLRRLLKNKTRI